MLCVWFILQPEDFGFVAGVVFGLLALLALLGLCLLWFFCPLITGVRNIILLLMNESTNLLVFCYHLQKIVGGLPPEPKEVCIMASDAITATLPHISVYMPPCWKASD